MSAINIRQEPIQTPVILWTDQDQQHLINLKNEQDPAVPTQVSATNPVCHLYKPGHHVHFIQLKSGIGKPIKPVTLISVNGNAIQVEANGQIKTWHNHRPERFQQLIDAYGGPVPGWEHEQHMFECQGHIFCMAMDEIKFEPCK